MLVLRLHVVTACCLLSWAAMARGEITSAALMDCLRAKFSFLPLRRVLLPSSGSLPRIETYGAFSEPVLIVGPPSGLLLNSESLMNEHHTATPGTNMILAAFMERGYGSEYVRWQFASGGGKDLPSLSTAQDGENFLSFGGALAHMERKRNARAATLGDNPESFHPSLFSLPPSDSACNTEVMSLLFGLGNTDSTPLYAISSTTGLMDAYHELKIKHSDQQRQVPVSQKLSPSNPSDRLTNQTPRSGNIGRENSHFESRRLSRSQRRKQRARRRAQYKPAKMKIPEELQAQLAPLEFRDLVTSRRSGFVDRMVEDGLLTSELPLGLSSAVTVQGLTVSPHGIDVYIGMTMSGSHLHAHGPAVSSSTGRKLWMLYSPSAQCELETPTGVSMLAKAGLPPLCTRYGNDERITFDKRNKFHKDSSLCLGQLHPLEILYKIGNLGRSMRPLLVVQEPGEIMILPGRWLHMTLNLEDLFTVSYRFGNPPPRNLGCPVRELLEHWNDDL